MAGSRYYRVVVTDTTEAEALDRALKHAPSWDSNPVESSRYPLKWTVEEIQVVGPKTCFMISHSTPQGVY